MNCFILFFIFYYFLGSFSAVSISVTIARFSGLGLQTPPPEAPHCRRTSSRVEFGVVGLFLCGEGCKLDTPALRAWIF